MKYLFFDIECANCFDGTVSFNELLKILETTEEELIKMPFPPESAFVSKQKDGLLLTRHQKSCSVTFGDLCMANEIDLRKIL